MLVVDVVPVQTTLMRSARPAQPRQQSSDAVRAKKTIRIPSPPSPPSLQAGREDDERVVDQHHTRRQKQDRNLQLNPPDSVAVLVPAPRALPVVAADSDADDDELATRSPLAE